MSNPAVNQLVEVGAELDALVTSFDTNYTWNYGATREGLRELYERAKREQWNATDQLAWDTEVDPEAEIIPAIVNPLQDYGPYKKLNAREKARFHHAQLSLQLSQFMHGEQGALFTASQLVSAVPWIDAKYYAATQTMDEARHVEVFQRYLRDKLEWQWPINPNLKSLLDMILTESRWDFKYLGMQILVEGLAMAAFGNLYQIAKEPLVKEIVRYVMKDEARHVAFGVISLKGFYEDMPEKERREREDFVIEVCQLMRDRLVGDDIARAFGWNREEVRKIVFDSPLMRRFREMLFMRVVPNIKKLGLLGPRVRKGFADLHIIQFEDVDTDALDQQLGLI